MNAALGFNDPFHDASFARLDDHSLHHVELERFTRQKMERQSPLLGFLDLMPGTALDGVAAIGVVEGDLLAPLFWHIARARTAAAAPDALSDELLTALAVTQDLQLEVVQAGLTHLGTLDRYRDRLRAFVTVALRPDVQLAILGHHQCHAGNAFLSSPFDDALSVSLDGGGYDFATDGARELIYGAAYRCTAEPLRLTRLPFAPDMTAAGAFARVGTQVLDLRFGEEGTVMAMAAYGDPARFRAALQPAWLWSTQPVLEADAGRDGLAQQIAGLRRAMKTEQDRFDLAAALQAQAAATVHAQLRQVVTPDIRALCLSGGLFLNCQIVGQVQGWFPWLERVFVPPAPYDGGLSIGVAQLLRHVTLGVPAPRPRFMPFASGPAAPVFDFIAACRARRLEPVSATPADVATRLASGQIGARFEGGAESGRRALGHRSILADPRDARVRDRINATIKHRAPFRPLAPMILAEDVQDWFHCPPGFQSPTMSHAIAVRDGMAPHIPAVIHRDGTARVQTVHRELTPGLHDLLTAFADITDVPILLNTSFNDQEPIVQTPAEAVECFLRTGLDFLYFAEPGLLLAR